jgi:hypothetical protein
MDQGNGATVQMLHVVERAKTVNTDPKFLFEIQTIHRTSEGGVAVLCVRVRWKEAIRVALRRCATDQQRAYLRAVALDTVGAYLRAAGVRIRVVNASGPNFVRGSGRPMDARGLVFDAPGLDGLDPAHPISVVHRRAVATCLRLRSAADHYVRPIAPSCAPPAWRRAARNASRAPG